MEQTAYGVVVHQGYADPSPYPEIKVQAVNRKYAAILMDDYAGPESELTAITQYLFLQATAKGKGAEAGRTAVRIAITEMHHMEMLASVIVLLGGRPVFSGNQSAGKGFWSGRYPYYGTALCDRLQAALNGEYQAIQNYEQHIRMIEDPDVQAILKRIVLDETLHVKILKGQISRFCR